MADEGIFGPNLVSIQVDTIIIASLAVVVTWIEIPSEIKERYKNIILSLYTMFLNKVNL